MIKKKKMTIKELIDLWPSKRVFAEGVGVSLGTASNWYYRESIPSDYLKAVLDDSHNHENILLTADELLDIAAG